MDKFQEMRVFAAVVDAGSFVGASDALDMSKPAVSRHVADLEGRLGVRLLHRTTRRLSLTDEGEVFYARCKELLASIEEAESEVTSPQRPGQRRTQGERSSLVRPPASGPAVGRIHGAPSQSRAGRDAVGPDGGSGRRGLRPRGAHRQVAEFLPDQPQALLHADGPVRIADLPEGERHTEASFANWPPTPWSLTACSRWARSGSSTGRRGASP